MTGSTETETINIMHISDLHGSENGNAEPYAEWVYNTFLESFRTFMEGSDEEQWKPDILVIT